MDLFPPFPRLLCLALTAVVLMATLSLPASAQAPRKKWTLDEVFPADGADPLRPETPEILGWTPDSRYYLVKTGEGVDKVAAVNGKVVASARVQAGDAPGTLVADLTEGLGGPRPVARAASPLSLAPDGGAFFLHGADGSTLYEFTPDGIALPGQRPQIKGNNPTFSPDGQLVAFTRDGNLYVAPKSATDAAKPLTKDGTATILNGQLDWVYEEEVYGRGDTKGFWWSPDSKYIAFLRIDDRPLKPYPIIDHLPRQQNVETWYYPLAGDPNPLITLWVVAADGKTAPKAVELTKYPETDRLIVRVAWSPDGKQVWFQMQNRIGSWLDLNAADATTGKTTTVLRERTEAWTEIIDNPTWLKDGSFLWLSDRTGYRHIYRYRPDGQLVRQVTEGEWDVRALRSVDEAAGLISYTGWEGSPINNGAYTVKLDGTGRRKVTREDAWHNFNPSPDGRFLVDTYSTCDTPPVTVLRDGYTGETLRTLTDNAALRERLATYQNPTVENLQVKARDGFVMEAQIIKPANFDPNKKYPVFMQVYAGPGAQTVRNSFGNVGGFDRVLAEKGIIIWRCDNRSASGKGMKSAWACYKQLGVSELQDIEDSLKYLATLPYVDAGRVGISGWSYGGFMTAYALTHSKLFKMGIAGAGVHDWHLYDTIYTERYMDTPQNNPTGYEATSVVKGAKDCTGKLLILHGMMDDNVHLQNSIQLIYELQKANKDFEVMIYPSPRSRHGIGDRDLNRHMREVELRFIEKNL
jgi:dipeptidyl-peptidase 4